MDFRWQIKARSLGRPHVYNCSANVIVNTDSRKARQLRLIRQIAQCRRATTRASLRSSNIPERWPRRDLAAPSVAGAGSADRYTRCAASGRSSNRPPVRATRASAPRRHARRRRARGRRRPLRGDRRECAPGWRRVKAQQHTPTEEETMVLATAKIGDFDRFWNTFSTKGAEKRKQHGCRGRTSFGIQMRATGFGRSSTGTRRAGRTSPRTRRSRRSSRKPGLRKVRPSRRSSSASTTPREEPA